MSQLNATAALANPGALAAEPLPGVPPLGSGSATRQQAAEDFEAYFIKLLFQEMQKTVESGGLFGDSSLQGYRALVDDALARRAAQAGSFGLAHQLLAQWEAAK